MIENPEGVRVSVVGGRQLDRRALLGIPVVDLPLLALPSLPLIRPLTADEVDQLHRWFADIERVFARVAAAYLPQIRALVDELVRAGVIPPAPPDGETPAQRVIRERRTRTYGPPRRPRAPRCLPVGGAR